MRFDIIGEGVLICLLFSLISMGSIICEITFVIGCSHPEEYILFLHCYISGFTDYLSTCVDIN